jgi:hypothetical protein
MHSAPTLPLILTLRPAAASYAATLSWESYAYGDYQLSTITKEVAVRVQPGGTGLAVAFETSPPTLAKPADPEPLAALARRLAALYARVLVQVAPTGEVTALLNHAELLRAGNELLLKMRASIHEDDQLTPAMLSFAERQLQSPAAFLRSLRNDYLYQALVPDYYGQSLGELGGPMRARQFANFFDKTDLWFTEQVAWEPGPTPQQLTLRLTGTLDVQKTDVAGVHKLIANALSLVPPPAGAATVLPAPHFHYAATYVLEQSTGLPFEVALSVYARAGLVYNKEYTLTLTRQ